MAEARAAIILAAGQGTRMKSARSKVLHEVGGRALLDWALAAAFGAGAGRVVAVVGPHAPEVGDHAATRGVAVAVQDEPLGTGHAVRAAQSALDGYDGAVAVMFGDTPLITPARIETMFALREKEGGLVALGFEPKDPTGYGRLLRDENGIVTRIVEHKDANEAERAVRLCNSGVLVADSRVLFQLLSMVRNDNAKREYYLTDIVGLGRSAGFLTRCVLGDEEEMLGVNSRADLARAEAAFQTRARAAALDAGVTLIDPATTYFSHDTQIAADVVVEPNVYFGPGVAIETGARICAYSHLEQCLVGAGARIGPFARLRPKARIGAHAHIGNFVEVKNVDVGAGAKANHLAYLGDGSVGPRANIGAGVIFCNYDGFDKYETTIGEEAFIGSDTALVAPVKVGARAYTGSGSVITDDVGAGALALGRGRQVEKPGWADAFRARKKAQKEKKA